LDQWNRLAAAKKNDAKLNVELTEQLAYMKEINDTVWKDMTSALDEFVNTGSINFSKLTQSILQDLLKIQLKKQALALWESASGGGGVMGLVSAGMKLFGFADGGSPPVGVPSMVGERGPELFVPKTAGTIIPNHMLKSNDSGPTINYNGPYIANMSAIDTQSGAAFLAKNKQAVWATYQSANRSVPMSR
jgi:phage-related minor tail protein